MTEAKCLMVQGTGSSVGKSVLVAALCRILRQDGFKVAPFKAQNMALNSAVTPDGLELGRAQAVQAAAAGIAPAVEMNPILLKPEADNRSQVVVRGRPVDVLAAADYYRRRDFLWPAVTESLARLRAAYDVIVIEGAGSPAEVNLRHLDIVNMRVAAHANAPVLLVGDIDRGGVFASLLGTLDLLAPAERELVKALIVNKFRGDRSLFSSGVRFLEERARLPVLGVVPFLKDIALAEEDSVVLEQSPNADSSAKTACTGNLIDVAVVQLPYVANFDDFDPLRRHPVVRMRYVSHASDLEPCDLIILPGTKTTFADLAWLRKRGLAAAIAAKATTGTPLIGICGGFQMLGERLVDPYGVESRGGAVDGLGLLPLTTEFARDKATCQVRARVMGRCGLLAAMDDREVGGYEIHMGRTCGPPTTSCKPAFQVVERSGQPADGWDGAVSNDGAILGTYIHGLFENEAFLHNLLVPIAVRKGITLAMTAANGSAGDRYDRLAAHVRAHLDVPRLYRIAGLRG